MKKIIIACDSYKGCLTSKDADLVITGEGHSDKQTLMGKLPLRILEHCLNRRKSAQLAVSQLAGDCKLLEPTLPMVWLVSGGVSDEQALLDAGFDRVVAVFPMDMPLQEAMEPEVARENIRKIFENFGK